MTFDNGPDASLAGAKGRDLSVQVAHALPGLAHVVQQNIQHVFVQHTFPVDGDGGDPNSFLEVGLGAAVE